MKRIISLLLTITMLLSLFSGFGISANAEAVAGYEISMNKQAVASGTVVYYDCQNEDIVFTISAVNYNDADRIAIYCQDETPSDSLAPIKYAYIKNINNRPINIRTFEGWTDSTERAAHKNLPADNYKICVCPNGGYDIAEEFNFTVSEHNPVVAEKGFAPTCKTAGLTDLIICSECETVIQEQTYIKPTEHNWGEWKVTKEATCREAGTETRVCANDKNHKETRDIPTTDNHRFGLVVTSTATTDHSGTVENRCLICGKRKGEFETPIIVPQIDKATLSKTSFAYDNTAKKPAVVVKDTGGAEITSRFYTVRYENNTKVGTAKAIITFSDRYEGTITLNFSIVLAKPTVKVSKVSQAAVALKWNKVAGAKYYRVYAYNTKTGKYTTVVKSTTATSCTVKKLAAGKTYYYLVRAYFLNKAGKEVLSPYTKANNVKAITLCKAPTVKAAVKGKTVTLKLAKVTGVKFYRVYKYNTKTKKYTTLLKSTTKLTASFKSQSKGNNYYLVRAFNANSKGSAYTTKNLVKAVVKK